MTTLSPRLEPKEDISPAVNTPSGFWKKAYPGCLGITLCHKELYDKPIPFWGTGNGGTGGCWWILAEFMDMVVLWIQVSTKVK